MLRSKVQGLFDRAYPCFVRQLGQTKNKVNADVPDSTFAKNPEGLNGSQRVVSAIHPAEDSVIERLDTHADSVHAKTDESADILGALFHNVFGVHLHVEFLEQRDRFDRLSDRFHHLNNAGQNIKRKHRWGASSYVERVDRIVSGHIQ